MKGFFEREREKERFSKSFAIIRFASRRTDSREESFFFMREREREKKQYQKNVKTLITSFISFFARNDWCV